MNIHSGGFLCESGSETPKAPRGVTLSLQPSFRTKGERIKISFAYFLTYRTYLSSYLTARETTGVADSSHVAH